MHRPGEMMYISALGKGMLMINSQRVAVDLLEKRSNISSDRPHFISVGDYMTKNLTFTLSPYGDLCVSCFFCPMSPLTHYRLRRFRRITAEGFSKSVVQHFYPIQNREAIMLALALMKSPPTLEKHFQRHASSIMFSVNYHLPPVESENDPSVVGVEKHVRRLLYEMQPGTRLVEHFPWLRHIPSR